MFRSTPSRVCPPILGALALPTFLLVGCAASSSSADSSASAAADQDGAVRPGVTIPTDVPNESDLRANVEISACVSDGDGWKAAGVARNPSGEDIAYKVTVFFTNDKATVLGSGDAAVKVSAGKSANWEVRADLTPASNMRCVLRGVGK